MDRMEDVGWHVKVVAKAHLLEAVVQDVEKVKLFDWPVMQEG